MKIVSPGCPCPCRPGRYVRFVIPPGVPGAMPTISCRPTDSVRHDDVREHDIPTGALIAHHVPGLTAV